MLSEYTDRMPRRSPLGHARVEHRRDRLAIPGRVPAEFGVALVATRGRRRARAPGRRRRAEPRHPSTRPSGLPGELSQTRRVPCRPLGRIVGGQRAWLRPAARRPRTSDRPHGGARRRRPAPRPSSSGSSATSSFEPIVGSTWSGVEPRARRGGARTSRRSPRAARACRPSAGRRARRSPRRARCATSAGVRVDRRADREVHDAVRVLPARAPRTGRRRPRGSRRGRRRPSTPRSVRRLRRQRGDHRVVLVDHADLGGATGRAHVVEELDVGLVVVLTTRRAGRPRSRSPRPGTPARTRRSRRTRRGGCRATGRPRRCSRPGIRRCRRGL